MLLPTSQPQTTSAVLMIRPWRFGYNAETAVSNTYQVLPTASAAQVHLQAVGEFDGLHALLVRNGVAVLRVDDLPLPPTPDSIFPNNWVSTHCDGTLVLYPMATANRRAERRPQLIEALRRDLGIRRVIDLTSWEVQGKYLEGTGSLVLDRSHRIAYAACSARTDPNVVAVFATAMGYRPLLFGTAPRQGQSVYHTNVVMSVGATLAVVCLDAIADGAKRGAVESALRATGRQVLPITIEQMDDFAGNLLELRSQAGEHLWVMSSRAYEAFMPAQRQQLASHGRILHSPLPTIESVGGGSARCMLGELFRQAPASAAVRVLDTTGALQGS